MGTLHVYIRTRNGRTESMFAVSAGSKVVFHNTDCDERLEVIVDRIEGKYRRARRWPKRITVCANDKEAFRIPLLTARGTMFKYSARIGRTKPEDPIIYVPGKKD